MYDYSVNSALALIDKQKKEDAERRVQLAKEQKKDAYDADIKSLAEQNLQATIKNQHIANKTFWVSVISCIIGLAALIFK
jgi:hypothetical protein